MLTGTRGRRLAAVCIGGFLAAVAAPSAALAADGDLDPTFAGDGTAAIDFAPSDPNLLFNFDYATVVIAGGAGDVVSAGSALSAVLDPGTPVFTTSDIVIARHNGDGTLDTSFSGDGKLTTDTGENESAFAVVERPGGAYVVAGESRHPETDASGVILTAYEPGGDPDAGFSGDGVVKESFGAANVTASDAVLQPDGKIVVAGTLDSQFFVARFEADGTLDAGFGDSGFTTVSFGSASFADGLALQDDGGIVVAGYSGGNFALARLDDEGDLDQTFSENGVLTTSFATSSAAHAVAVQPDGKIVAAGDAQLGEGGRDFATARYLADGALDASYSGDGRQTNGTPQDDLGRDIALQENGRAVVSGNSNGDFLVARIRTDGEIDPTFGGTGVVTFETGTGGVYAGEGVAIQADGKVLTAGGEFTPSDPNNDMIVARLEADPDPPETSIDAGPAEGATIADRTPEFQFSSDEGGEEFECSVDGAAFEACTDPKTLDPLTLGAHTFRVAAIDAAGNVDPSSTERTFTVDTPDTAPSAGDDEATVIEDSTANPVDVLANDSDPDGTPVTVTSVDDPENGTATITGGGAGISYTPDPDYCNDPGASGNDEFDYGITGEADDSVQAEGTIEVTVTCVDDAPVAVDDDGATEEDTAVTIDVRANDTDVDGGPITVTDSSDGAEGAVEVAGDGGDVTYTPGAEFCGDDQFTYELNGGSSATVEIEVRCVDDRPVAVDDAATVVEDSGANAIDVRANDTDIDGGPKEVTAAGGAANGSAAVSGGGASVAYTPAGDFCGEDSFTYSLNGGSTARVAVTVTCVDDPSPPPSEPPPSDPPVSSASCDDARAALARSERRFDKAQDKVMKAKSNLRKADGKRETKAAKRKLKKAKAKKAGARDALASAAEDVAAAC